MNACILTEVRNFKTFLKGNYAITLDLCHLFIKENVEHGIEHGIYSTYGVCIH